MTYWGAPDIEPILYLSIKWIFVFKPDRYGWRVADPICSFAISVLIIASSIPLLHELTGTLTQRTPDNVRRKLGPCLDQVLWISR